MELDLTEDLILAVTRAGCWDSFPSKEGKRGVPGGVISLLTQKVMIHICNSNLMVSDIKEEQI